MSCQMESWLGAYVLDALEPDEAASIQAHLVGCRSCRDDVVGLSWIPEVLGRVNIADAEQLDDRSAPNSSNRPSSGFLERLIASASRERRDRRRHRYSAAIAGAALLTIGAGVTAAAMAGAKPAQTATVRAVDPKTHVNAVVKVTARSWGTQLQLQLSGAYPGGQCALVAHAEDGRVDTAASWVASDAGTANVPGATAIPADQLAELDVVTADGWQLVRVPLPDQHK
jgi:hypothetical protein